VHCAVAGGWVGGVGGPAGQWMSGEVGEASPSNRISVPPMLR